MNKTDRIDIYIDEKTKNILKQFCMKHHVSFSCVIDTLLEKYFLLITNDFKNLLLENYLKKGSHTSVKVKDTLRQTNNLAREQKSKLYSNLIYLYFNKLIKNYVNNAERRQNLFIKEIDKKQEEYWNYNQAIRNTTRMLKNKKTRQYLQNKIDNYERRKSC